MVKFGMLDLRFGGQTAYVLILALTPFAGWPLSLSFLIWFITSTILVCADCYNNTIEEWLLILTILKADKSKRKVLAD